MGLLSLRPRNSIESPTLPLTSTALLDWLTGPKVHAGVTVNEATSLGFSAVWRAVNLIAGTNASLPLHAYRQADDVRVPVTSGSAVDLLSNPHPDLTSFELWEQVYAHLLLWGNAYLRTLRNQAGQIVELWPLHPSRVKATRADDGTKLYQVDGDYENPLTDTAILHIPGFGYDGISGVGPIRLAREGIGLALAAEEFGARLFGSGSLASGVLQTEQRLNQDAADRLKAAWKAKVSGLNNAHEVAVLDSGAKFQQLTIPPEDAQFIESRKFQIVEVARWFGIPAHMLGDVERSTSWGTGIEQQAIGFVVYTLRPWLSRVEQRLTRLLKPNAVYARYSVEGLLRGDSQQRAEFYNKMWNIGVFSTNDIRKLENQQPVDGGDVRYRPLNMGVLGQADPSTVETDPSPNQPDPTEPSPDEPPQRQGVVT